VASIKMYAREKVIIDHVTVARELSNSVLTLRGDLIVEHRRAADIELPKLQIWSTTDGRIFVQVEPGNNLVIYDSLGDLRLQHTRMVKNRGRA
jgi:hypothetical protein